MFGGQNPTFWPEPYLKVGDIVVKWEGEKGLVHVLENDIREGIIDSPELTIEEWREATMGINYEAAPWEKIWEFNRKNYGLGPAVRLITQIGCKRGCVFCSTSNFIRIPKYLTTQQLRQLCDRVAKFMPDDAILILQGDDELYGRARRRFFELYEQGYRFPRPVSLQTEVRRIDEETVKVLKGLGVFEVCLGIESFSDNILREFNKKATVEENERCLELLLKYGIRPYANIILHGLGIYSTQADVEYTKQRIEYWKKRGVRFGVNERIIPLPGTKVWSLQHATQANP